MDSYELLELCDHLPDDSALKTAIRGDLSERDEMLRQIANEIAVLRAGMVPNAHGEDYGSHLFMAAGKLREMADAASEAQEARDSLTPRVAQGQD
jgi:hypothetical protein